LFFGHLKQIANYALHRGYFVKRFPQTSLKPSYFVPSVFMLVLFFGGVFGLFIDWLRAAYLFGVCFYLFLVIVFSINVSFRILPLVVSGIAATHITYGSYFFKGLFVKRLSEEVEGVK
jgi:hypothetical protein